MIHRPVFSFIKVRKRDLVQCSTCGALLTAKDTSTKQHTKWHAEVDA